MFWLRMSAATIFFTALLPYCPTALLPYCPTALLPYCPTPHIFPIISRSPALPRPLAAMMAGTISSALSTISG
ncbi:hypothetical protein BKD03_08605 [Brucella sp. 09RB8471]|nr:hypothetical protein BKD03_08605 [Brucella sp. 09RB8471]